MLGAGVAQVRVGSVRGVASGVVPAPGLNDDVVAEAAARVVGLGHGAHGGRVLCLSKTNVVSVCLFEKINQIRQGLMIEWIKLLE